jgi:hypothetical protein
MKTFTRRSISILILFLFPITAIFAQAYFAVSYQGSIFTKGLPNFKNEVYKWNHITYPNFEEKFEFNNFFHGLGFEFGGFTRDNWHVFTGWENKHFITEGKGTYTEFGKTYEGDITVKVRHNIFHTVGLGYKFSNKFTFGASALDLGNFKVLKQDRKSTENPDEFVQVYQGNTGLFSQNTTMGMTLYADFYPIKFFRIRGSYYFDYFKNKLGIDPFYTYQLNAFNVQAALIIGKNK